MSHLGMWWGPRSSGRAEVAGLWFARHTAHTAHAQKARVTTMTVQSLPRQCPTCSAPVQPHLRSCHACETEIGFPNVRAAEDERPDLLKRYHEAMKSAEHRGALKEIAEFEKTAKGSWAILCRSLSQVDSLVSGDNAVYVSFHAQVDSGARMPRLGDHFEEKRPIVDAAIFPRYHDKINFAALSLGGPVPSNYGQYTIVLKDTLIAKRSSVFEENSFLFIERHQVQVAGNVPRGFRAVWNERHVLAVAKHANEIQAQITPDKFPGILSNNQRAKQDPDFIEVHIFGGLTRAAIDRVIGPEPKQRVDKVLWKALLAKLVKNGIRYEKIA